MTFPKFFINANGDYEFLDSNYTYMESIQLQCLQEIDSAILTDMNFILDNEPNRINTDFNNKSLRINI